MGMVGSPAATALVIGFVVIVMPTNSLLLLQQILKRALLFYVRTPRIGVHQGTYV